MSVSPVEEEETVVRDPLVGAQLGEYDVVRILGEGGMGVVYEGLHTAIRKRVAIKVIKAEFASDPIWSSRMLIEAQAVNAVRHRGIVDVHAHGLTPDKRPYLVMEFLDGKPLDLVLAEGLLPFEVAAELLLDISAPLAAAHRAGVVHRDLKPSNIFVCRDDDGASFIKLLDFGLAKQAKGTGHTMTGAQIVIGTPDYMAPEQAKAHNTDARTDIYSLGIMGFELFVGHRPYLGETPVEIMLQHISSPIPKLVDVVPGISDRMSALVSSMMSKLPGDRPLNIEVVRDELKLILGRPHSLSGSRISSPHLSAVSSASLGGAGLKTSVPDNQISQSDLRPETHRSRKIFGIGLGVVSVVACLGALVYFVRSPDAPLAIAVAEPQRVSEDLVGNTAKPGEGPIQLVAEVPTENTDAGGVNGSPPDAGSRAQKIPSPVVAVRPGKVRKKVPTVDELLTRIARFEVQTVKLSDPTAQQYLKKYRGEAERAAADKQRQALAAKLDTFQKTFKLK
jgi:eukaryotic-like serine/threonine-protein kinase